MAGGQGLTKQAQALFASDLSGVKNELARIQTFLRDNLLTRDDVGRADARRKNVMAIHTIVKESQAQQQHDELVQELRLTREAMTHQGSGVTNFTNNPISLPRRPSAADSPH